MPKYAGRIGKYICCGNRCHSELGKCAMPKRRLKLVNEVSCVQMVEAERRSKALFQVNNDRVSASKIPCILALQNSINKPQARGEGADNEQSCFGTVSVYMHNHGGVGFKSG